MFLIVPEDLERLQRMTGLTEMPEDIEREYAIRIRYLHSSGGYGALGASALIDLLRFLGHAPKKIEQAPTATDWSKVPFGQPVLAGPYLGEMKPGIFRGFCHLGSLSIEMEEGGLPVTKEVPARMCQLASPEDLLPAPSDKVPLPTPPAPAGKPLTTTEPKTVIALIDGQPTECNFVCRMGSKTKVELGGVEHILPSTDVAI